jgi:hypothetical protein
VAVGSPQLLTPFVPLDCRDMQLTYLLPVPHPSYPGHRRPPVRPLCLLHHPFLPRPGPGAAAALHQPRGGGGLAGCLWLHRVRGGGLRQASS